LEAGAEDIKEEETSYEVFTDPKDFWEVRTAFDEHNMEYALAEIAMVPKNTVKLEGKEAEQMIRLMEMLEDADDVQKTHANFDIAEDILEKMSG
jgi:transcriptional/translational regulatory protein YebC/TACO1